MTCFKFFKKYVFGPSGQFGPVSRQYYVIYDLRIHSKDFFQTLQQN